MNKPLISAIIPAYNSERTIKRCIESLMQHTDSIIEIIIIDDGSTDDTASIIKPYLKRFPNIIYNRQSNRGVASARNRGIQLATGEFVLFIDSDDYIESNYISTLQDKAMKDDLDVCISVREDVYEKIPKRELIASCLSFDEKYAFANIDAPWGKLFRLNIISENNICFPEELHRSEDALFCSLYYQFANSIGFVKNTGYKHLENEGSLCRRFDRTAPHQLSLILKRELFIVDNYFSNESDLLQAVYYRALPGIIETEQSYFFHSEQSSNFYHRIVEYSELISHPVIRKCVFNVSLSHCHKQQYIIRTLAYRVGFDKAIFILKYIHTKLLSINGRLKH